ncbi:MAG: chromate transporter [Bryobacteraceae bacterium]
MNLLLLYLLLTKATLTSFSGLTSLPVVRQDLVVRHAVLTDLQLNAAVAAGRTVPGPNGIYIASVGYFVAGVPGAIAGCLAMITPAFLIVPLLRYIGAKADEPAVRNGIGGLMLAAAGLIVAAIVPLARESVTGLVPLLIAGAAFALVSSTRVSTLWIMLGAALANLAAATAG